MNLVIELSRYSMTFGFAVAIYVLVVIAIGLKKKDKRYIESGYRGLYLICFFFTFSSLGMISAFDSIQLAGDVSPSLVAGGIKVALITTVSGLIVAIILQVFYNTIVAKIDSIVNKMEDSSISLIDLLVHHNLKK